MYFMGLLQWDWGYMRGTEVEKARGDLWVSARVSAPNLLCVIMIEVAIGLLTGEIQQN